LISIAAKAALSAGFWLAGLATCIDAAVLDVTASAPPASWWPVATNVFDNTRAGASALPIISGVPQACFMISSSGAPTEAAYETLNLSGHGHHRVQPSRLISPVDLGANPI
jgi:hypothetical protein